MIQQSERIICINHDRSSGIKTANCNSSDPFQRWIWTRHSQLFHVETSKCIQQGKMFPRKMYAWHLGLEECNVSETKQQWKCEAGYLQKDFYVGRQQMFMYITNGNARIFAKSNAPTNWKRYESNSRICSSCMFLALFTLFFSFLIILFFFLSIPSILISCTYKNTVYYINISVILSFWPLRKIVFKHT